MPYSAANKALAKAFLKGMRATTRCERCGNKPVDFHHESHERDSNTRVAHLAALGFPVSRIKAEIDKCEALCRSCHMKEDGRASRLTAARPRKKGDRLPPKLCSRCRVPAKPLRKGLCNRCNHKKRKGQF